jgi:hypothetical protein
MGMAFRGRAGAPKCAGGEIKWHNAALFVM